VHRRRHQGVDLATRQLAEVVRIARDDGLAGDLGRPVALVGHADELVAEPEGAHDLGGGGEQGNDSHGSGAARRRRHAGGFKASTSDRAAPLSTYHCASIWV
jgi:hypothetical protein